MFLFIIPKDIWINEIITYLISSLHVLRLVCKKFRNDIIVFPIWKQFVPIEYLNQYVQTCNKLSIIPHMYGIKMENTYINKFDTIPDQIREINLVTASIQYPLISYDAWMNFVSNLSNIQHINFHYSSAPLSIILHLWLNMDINITVDDTHVLFFLLENNMISLFTIPKLHCLTIMLEKRIKDYKGLNTYRNKSGSTLLQFVIEQGITYDIIKWLLDNGCMIDEIDSYNQTAMFYAINHHPSIIPSLVKEYKPNLNHLNDDKLSILSLGLNQRLDNQTINYLLSHGANPHDVNETFWTPIEKSIICSNFSLFYDMIKYINNINEVTDGRTLLGLTLQLTPHSNDNHTLCNIVLSLLEYGADPNMGTIMEDAEKRDCQQCIELLVQYGGVLQTV